MGKIIRRILMAVLLVILVVSVGAIVRTKLNYRAGEQIYQRSAEQFVTAKTPEPAAETARPESSAGPAEAEAPKELAPIQVDFAALRAVNPEIVGWIYCEDTVINYPVLQGADDDYYLKHAYDGTASSNGSIFVEMENAPGFADANTILYGHNMKNRTMFGTLEDWADQSYYEAHPVIWLLTPEQDYRILLFSGYSTYGGSDSYLLFSEHGQELEKYLQGAVRKSDFVSPVELRADGRYVLLSTCAYGFSNARYVLHGMLEEVDSAGGAGKMAAEAAGGG